jgi:hypothetical protein
MPSKGRNRTGINFSLPIPMVADLKADRNLRAAVTRSLEDWWMEQKRADSLGHTGGKSEPQDSPSCL